MWPLDRSSHLGQSHVLRLPRLRGMGRSPMGAKRNAVRDTRTVKPSPFKPCAGGEPLGRCLSRLPVRGKDRCVPKMPPHALKDRQFKTLAAPFFYPARKNLQSKQGLKVLYIV